MPHRGFVDIQRRETMIVPFRPLPGTTINPRFPDEDGRFMGDTDFHYAALIWLKEALQDYLTRPPGWYVASNLILYWDFNDPKKRRDPDILVARGVGGHFRRSFRVWEEGTFPRVLFEIASKKTWREDVGPKKQLYADLGIPEYFIFDPEGKYIRPVLQGFRHKKRGVYTAIRPARDGSLTSKELGLCMVPEGAMLRLIEAATGEPIPIRLERAEQEKRRADELAAEVERLRAELKRQRRRRSKE
jgi:Uma2 family endonuclease